jgi:hypothetical protein
MYLWEGLHKIHGDVSPDPRGHGQRLEETRGMKSLRLVPLVGGARVDIVAYNTTIMLDEELSP